MNSSESICKVDHIGTRRWYLDGHVHREDGPAVIYLNGEEWWCQQSKIHREGGPAYTNNNGQIEWWLDHETYTLKQYVKRLYGNSEEATAFILKWAK